MEKSSSLITANGVDITNDDANWCENELESALARNRRQFITGETLGNNFICWSDFGYKTVK